MWRIPPKGAVLRIHALDDPGPPVAGARMILERIAHSELVTFAKGGHLILHHEGKIKKRIREFILKISGVRDIPDARSMR